MSAPDAIRGFNFQTAYAVRAALRVLADPSVSAIRVEGVDDAVDVETIGSDGVSLRLIQVKSRDPGSPWGKAAVFDACERLAHLSSDATLVFFTDAPFGPELRDKILPAIAAVVAGTADEADRTTLQQADLGAFRPEILARLDLQDNQPRVDVQLALAEADVRSLIELHEPSNAARARAAVDALFRLLGLRAGERQDAKRVVQRADLAAALAVPLESIDAAGRWDEAARAAYVNDADKNPMRAPAILATDLAIDDAVELGVEGITGGMLQSADGDQTSPQTVADLLGFGLVGLVSPAGGGKSTSIGLLARIAARNGSLPIVLAAVDLVGSSIEREAARSAQIRVGRTFAPGTGAEMVRDRAAVLMIDGVGDLPASDRGVVMSALRRLHGDRPWVRIIATGRAPDGLAAMHCPIVELRPLDELGRQAVAEQVVTDPRQAERVLKVVASSGAKLDTPLLLVLALQDAVAGDPPRSRAKLLERFIQRLWARGNEARSDVITIASGRAAARLIADGERAPQRYRWLSELAASTAELADRGVIERGSLSAEDMSRALEHAGLFRAVGGTDRVGGAHDLVFEFLAAKAMVQGGVDYPTQLTADPWLEAASLAAELSPEGPADELIDAAWADPQTATRVGLHARGPSDITLAADLLRRLLTLHGPTDIDAGTVALSERNGATLLDVEQGTADHAGGTRRLAIRDAKPAAPPALAARLWMALLAERLDQRVWDAGGVTVPQDPSDFPAAIREWWHQRAVALTAECEALPEVLAQRVRQLLPSGIRAWILPAQTVTVGARSVGISAMSYKTTDAPEIRVDLVDVLPDEAPALMMNVIAFLWATPRESARAEIREAINVLLPGVE